MVASIFLNTGRGAVTRLLMARQLSTGAVFWSVAAGRSDDVVWIQSEQPPARPAAISIEIVARTARSLMTTSSVRARLLISNRQSERTAFIHLRLAR